MLFRSILNICFVQCFSNSPIAKWSTKHIFLFLDTSVQYSNTLLAFVFFVEVCFCFFNLNKDDVHSRSQNLGF